MLLCLQGARPRGGARASPRRLLATGCAGGGRPNARTRGARCVLTTRRDGADRARRDGVDHGRRDGADRARRDGHRRGNGGQQPCGRGPRAPGCDCDYGAAWFRPRAGVSSPGVSLGGPRGHGAILRGKLLIGHGAIHRLKKCILTMRRGAPSESRSAPLGARSACGDTAQMARGEMTRTARGDGADGARRRRGETARRRRGDTAPETARRDGAGPRVHQMQHAKTGLLSCVIKVASQISKCFISKL